HPWSRYREVVCHRWSRGRVAIVGDAAHAMSADLGQGANCAMSNALSLGNWLLGERGGVEAALAAWERQERPHTEARQRWSRLVTNANLRWPRPLERLRAPLLRWSVAHTRWPDVVAALADYEPAEPAVA